MWLIRETSVPIILLSLEVWVLFIATAQPLGVYLVVTTNFQGPLSRCVMLKMDLQGTAGLPPDRTAYLMTLPHPKPFEPLLHWWL